MSASLSYANLLPLNLYELLTLIWCHILSRFPWCQYKVQYEKLSQTFELLCQCLNYSKNLCRVLKTKEYPNYQNNLLDSLTKEITQGYKLSFI
jgi:hypothetical protein